MDEQILSKGSRGGRGQNLSLDTALALAKKIESYSSTKTRWTKLRIIEAADEIGVDRRTLEKYQKHPEKLILLIGKLRRAEDWAFFFEGMRLLSTPMQDLQEYMGQYIPHLTVSVLLAKKSDWKRRSLASVGTFYDKARECFDSSGFMRTVRERRSDLSLDLVVKNNLKEWPPGTIGVHTVPITWDLDHGKGAARDKAYSETGGRMGIMLLAERKAGLDKAVAFSPVEANSTDEEKANDIKEFLEDIEAPTKVVRLVTGRRDDGFVPTTMDKDVLQRLLGDLAIVEVDVPTIGLKANFAVTSKIAQTFKVKGRFRSIDAMYKYLHDLLNKEYKGRTSVSKKV